MRRLQEMIEELSRRANDSDLIALLATSRDARVYNGVLARELRDVVEVLKRELEWRRSAALQASSEIQLVALDRHDQQNHSTVQCAYAPGFPCPRAPDRTTHCCIKSSARAEADDS